MARSFHEWYGQMNLDKNNDLLNQTTTQFKDVEDQVTNHKIFDIDRWFLLREILRTISMNLKNMRTKLRT
jgi:hypothetical protein